MWSYTPTSQTDRQTDDMQSTFNTALCTTVHRAVKDYELQDKERPLPQTYGGT